MKREPTFQGTLGPIHFPDLLTFLDMLGKTGTLELLRDDACKRIYWDRGEIVFADSSLEGDRVPEFLARNGEIPPAAVRAARASARSERDVIGSLIQSGSLEPAGLPRAVRDLVLDIAYSLFEWDSGSFRFDLTEQPHAERLPLRASVANVIVEGCRRIDEWKRIREHLPDDHVIPVRQPLEVHASMRLAPSDEEVLAQVDGESDLAALVESVSLDHFSTLSSLLALVNAGLVKVQASPAPRSPPPAAPPLVIDGFDAPGQGAAEEILSAFNAMFAGICSRIRGVKGPHGVEKFTATLKKPSFQQGGVLRGIEFDDAGRIDAPKVLRNVARIEHGERLAQLRGGLDRLLAQQVIQLDTAFTAADRQAITDLIATQKARLARLMPG